MQTSRRLAELRARHALGAAALDPERPLALLDSVTNEVWDAGDVVVRMNRRTFPRLRREAHLARALPAEARYPEVLAFGTDAGQDWLIMRKVGGTPLVRCWPRMGKEERRAAVVELAGAVRAIHATPANEEPASIKELPHPLQAGPHATDPLCDALEQAGRLPHVDKGAMADAVGWVRTLRTAIVPFESSHLVHGDLHFQNVLWDGEHVSALLDLEFARGAPADLDLDVLLRFCTLPFLFVPEGREAEARPDDYADVPFWFREAYPELFSHRRLLDRLRIYAVAFDVRDLLANPPRCRASDLTRHHPYRRLLANLRGHGHLDLLAAR